MSDMTDTLDAPQFGHADAGHDHGGGTAGIRQPSASIRDQATEKLKSFADEGKQQVTNSLDGLVQAAREIAGKLDDGAFGPVAGYAHDAADRIEQFAGSVKDKSVEDLVDDVRDFAEANPALAVGIAVAAGFALSRFLKSSGGR